MARWWAEFVQGGSEVAYLRPWIARYGEPVLDAGCGTGRLLLPYLRDGIDIDGVDVSADMIEACREAARREGLEPELTVQALHELSLDRRYRTIILCGVFGIGATRAQDERTLRLLHDLLEPGGAIVILHYLPWDDAQFWRLWLPEERSRLPETFPEASPPRATSDGGALRIRSRVLAFDPAGPTIVREVLAEGFCEGVLERREVLHLRENLYFPNELALLLERAGFRAVQVRHDHPSSDFGPEGGVFAVIGERQPSAD